MKKIVIALIVIIGLAVTGFVYANTSLFSQAAKTSTATTTPSYMTAGAATTTLTFDSWARSGTNQTDQGNTLAIDSAVLLLQQTSTSTPSTLRWTYEFSQDGIDWYADSIDLTTNATTTITVRTFKEYSWVFASSTPGGVKNPLNRALKMVDVPTPLRFTRAIIYLAPASAAADVYAEIQPKQEVKN